MEIQQRKHPGWREKEETKLWTEPKRSTPVPGLLRLLEVQEDPRRRLARVALGARRRVAGRPEEGAAELPIWQPCMTKRSEKGSFGSKWGRCLARRMRSL